MAALNLRRHHPLLSPSAVLTTGTHGSAAPLAGMEQLLPADIRRIREVPRYLPPAPNEVPRFPLLTYSVSASCQAVGRPGAAQCLPWDRSQLAGKAARMDAADPDFVQPGEEGEALPSAVSLPVTGPGPAPHATRSLHGAANGVRVAPRQSECIPLEYS